MNRVTIIGGGLAGSEAAWQLAERNCRVRLIDMKPHKFSPVHSRTDLAELVCSNSFRSNDRHSAIGLLKEEMRRCNSLIVKIADDTAVPAGKALAVDRDLFSEQITGSLEQHSLIEITREEIITIPPESSSYTIIATGPLTSEPLAESLADLTGRDRLAFYDAIAPIVYAESLDMEIIYSKSRYEDGPGDYLNCPMDKDTYLRFIEELAAAACVPLKSFEDVKYFEGCLPIEVIRSRGDDTLRFGPMKPVGLEDPKTGRTPYAVVQLRKENIQGTTSTATPLSAPRNFCGRPCSSSPDPTFSLPGNYQEWRDISNQLPWDYWLELTRPVSHQANLQSSPHRKQLSGL